MNGKDLGRLLASHGASPSGVTVTLQKLRAAFKVSVGGRGFNAHDLTADEMAWIVAAYAGSDVPARADETFDRLLKLRAARSEPKQFIHCFQLILSGDIKGVREIRISRNASFAQIKFDDGTCWTFANWRAPAAKLPLFRSEGVISAGLIAELAKNVVVKDDPGFAGAAIEAEDQQ